MIKYKIFYVDGYAEVLREGEFAIVGDFTNAKKSLIIGLKDGERLINWDNVVSIMRIKEGV